MQIENIVNLLNKERGYTIDPGYYKHIAIWREWWQGYCPEFHRYREFDGSSVRTRRKYGLRMAKKICEDWANILLNEKTQIIVDDEYSNEYLRGKNGISGLLGNAGFWQAANALVEKAFWSGTGAILLRINNATISGGSLAGSNTGEIDFDYVPASGIIPLTLKHGRIIDCAFVSEVVEKGQKYLYLETHVKEGGRYRITNEYYKKTDGAIVKTSLPDDLIPEYTAATDTPFFAIIK
ncbi:MAG: hypothetical protein Q4C00_05495, partial [Bacillota bacterium]|nr:hypothetical protein [Bacillota bacterium]